MREVLRAAFLSVSVLEGQLVPVSPAPSSHLLIPLWKEGCVWLRTSHGNTQHSSRV